MFSPQSPSQSTLSQSAKALCFFALTMVMGLVDLGSAQAAPKIGDKQIDRPSAWTTWWCHQGNIPFVANGPDLTVVFQAEKYLPNDTGFAGQRLDNVAIVKKTVFDAHQVTAVAGCGQCNITQGGPSSLDLPNVSLSEFLFLDQFHSAVDPAWTLGTDAAFADTGQSGPFSAPNEFNIANCDETGGCLIFGEPGDPIGISDASFSISNLEEGVEYVLSFWWRSLNDIPQETPLLFVDLFGTTHWADQTPGYLASTIYGVGVSFGDHDGNGTQDLHITQTNFANQLLENVLTNFNDVTTGDVANPGPGTMALWADFLGNELPDLYLFNDGGPNLLLQNTGGAILVDVTPSPLDDADPATGGAVADFDNDGDLDIYLCKDGSNRLMRNDGPGTWVDAATLDARNPNVTRAAQFADYDLDGDQDLFLANDGAANSLLENIAGGYFDVTPASIGANTDASFDVAWGDYDNDGDPDIYVSNMSGSNQLFRNDLGGVFTDVTTSPIDGSYETDAAEWFDADNDGDLDLYV
ncbi:MAG: VCBS repeat-containing protein, partial [Candidatus Eisenbacteria bacterium]|nr:VCBS repeat-containing protein [Candidatus Eisenbacteria bacterium]